MLSSCRTSSSIGTGDGVNVEELPLTSFLDFLPLLEKIDPNIWMLSGRSDREEGMLPLLERADDLRDREDSVPGAIDSFDRKEGVVEEKVFVLVLFPNIELRFICSVYARMRSGEGGPSMAGRREIAEFPSFFFPNWGASLLGFLLPLLTE